MCDKQEQQRAQALQDELNKRFSRLKWKVHVYDPGLATYLIDESFWLVVAKLELKDDGLTGYYPIMKALFDGDGGAEAVADGMVWTFVNKIIHDPLDVRKAEFICT